MKTCLKRVKAVLQSNSTLNAYVKRVEIVAPRLLPEIPSSLVPYIGIAPVRTAPAYVAQKKELTHLIDLYIVTYLQVVENAIIGDSVKKGITELESDVRTAIEGHRLPEASVNYLSKPIVVSPTEYSVAGYGDQIYLMVGSMTLSCIRLETFTLP